MYEIVYICKEGDKVVAKDTAYYEKYADALNGYKEKTCFVSELDDGRCMSVSHEIGVNRRKLTVEDKGGIVTTLELKESAGEPEDEKPCYFNELLPEEREAAVRINKDYIVAKAKEWLMVEWLDGVAELMRGICISESKYDFKINGTYCQFVFHADRIKQNAPFSDLKDAVYSLGQNVPKRLAGIARESMNKELLFFHPSYMAALTRIFSELSLRATRWISCLSVYDSYVINYLTKDKSEQDFADTEWFGKFHRDGSLAPEENKIQS